MWRNDCYKIMESLYMWRNDCYKIMESLYICVGMTAIR